MQRLILYDIMLKNENDEKWIKGIQENIKEYLTEKEICEKHLAIYTEKISKDALSSGRRKM